MIRRLSFGVLRWYPLLLALAGWEALAHSGLVHHLLTPSLEEIWTGLLRGIRTGDILYHAQWTLSRAGLGFGLAIVAGVAIGAAMALSGPLEELLEPIFSFGYPIPKIALYPIFAFLFGLGPVPKVALVFLECLYPIAVSTYQGMKLSDHLGVWAARTMGAREWQIFWRVRLPNALPYVMSSLRISAHVAIATIVILEMVGDNTGLGYFVSYTAAAFDFRESFAVILVIVAIGFVVDRSLIALRRGVIFWERQDAEVL